MGLLTFEEANNMIYWELILFSYLLGSFPTALLVSKLKMGIDIRQHGDKNPGATNVFRVMGEKASILVLTIDLLKGIIAVLLPLMLALPAEQFYSMNLMQFLMGLAAVMGHRFPLFTRFKGGKGIATLFGVIIALRPLMALSFGIVFLILFLLHESTND